MVAASVADAFFVAAKELTFLSITRTTPPFGFALLVDAHGSPASWMPMLAYAVPIGVICGGVALVGVLLLGVGKRLGRLTHGALSRLGGRHLGLLLTPVVGGGLLGLLARVFPLVLGDGNLQLGAVLVSAFDFFVPSNGTHAGGGPINPREELF